MIHKQLGLNSKIQDCSFLPENVQSHLYNNGISKLVDLILLMPKRYISIVSMLEAYKIAQGTEVFMHVKIMRINSFKYAKVQVSQNCKKAIVYVFGTNKLKYQLWQYLRSQETIGLLCKIGPTNQYGILTLKNCQFGSTCPYSHYPIYKTKYGIPSHHYNAYFGLLKHNTNFSDNLDAINVNIRKLNGLIDVRTAISYIHYPQCQNLAQVYEKRYIAEKRLCVEEFSAWVFKCKTQKKEDYLKVNQGHSNYHSVSINLEKHNDWLNSVPFTLRTNQTKSIAEIYKHLKLTKRMMHIIQGDVGTGKTIVSLAVLNQIVNNGLKALILVPNILLGKQNAELASRFIKCPVYYLYGKLSPSEKNIIKNQFVNVESPSILVSTTSCFQIDFLNTNVGLIVIDEHHKFGVSDVEKVISKCRIKPHVIFMTATPIPRTMAMIYSNLITRSHLASLDSRKVKTLVMSDNQRKDILSKLKEAISLGKQAYWVCPLKEHSWGDNVTINEIADIIKSAIPYVRSAVITGDTDPEVSSKVLNDFKKGYLDVLISTTVIEVGIDIPQVNIMIIENASSFGLRQIHQLRGRIGRDHRQSYCILLYSSNAGVPQKEYLYMMRNTIDGDLVSCYDLGRRGMGNLLGLEQSGFQFMKIRHSKCSLLDSTQHYKTILDNSIIDFVQDQNNDNSIKGIDAIIDTWL